MLGVVCSTYEVHAVRHAELLRLQPVAGRVGAADDYEVRCFVQTCERGQCVVEALPLEAVADEEQEAGARSESELTSNIRAVSTGKTCDVDRRGDDIDALARHAVYADHVVGDAFRHGDDAREAARSKLEPLDAPSGSERRSGYRRRQCPETGERVILSPFCGPAALIRVADSVDGHDVVMPSRRPDDVDDVEGLLRRPDRSRRRRCERRTFDRVADPPPGRHERSDWMETHAGNAVSTGVGIAVAVHLDPFAGELGSQKSNAPLETAGEVDVPVDEGDSHRFEGTQVARRLP